MSDATVTNILNCISQRSQSCEWNFPSDIHGFIRCGEQSKDNILTIQVNRETHITHKKYTASNKHLQTLDSAGSCKLEMCSQKEQYIGISGD